MYALAPLAARKQEEESKALRGMRQGSLLPNRMLDRIMKKKKMMMMTIKWSSMLGLKRYL